MWCKVHWATYLLHRISFYFKGVNSEIIGLYRLWDRELHKWQVSNKMRQKSCSSDELQTYVIDMFVSSETSIIIV